jgi:hypothetical protein
VKIEYSTNNSGGRWWLSDDDWYALEKAGWEVNWNKDNPDRIMVDKKTGRFLGALAEYASKEFETPADAMREFEKVTGQRVSDEGCNCCGAPHSFSWDGGYASGDDCLEHLYAHAPKSLREACEQLEKNESAPD